MTGKHANTGVGYQIIVDTGNPAKKEGKDNMSIIVHEPVGLVGTILGE